MFNTGVSTAVSVEPTWEKYPTIAVTMGSTLDAMVSPRFWSADTNGAIFDSTVEPTFVIAVWTVSNRLATEFAIGLS